MLYFDDIKTQKNKTMTYQELQQEIESQKNQVLTMTEEKYERLMYLAQFGDEEGNNALEQLEEYHAQEAQQSAFDSWN